MKQSIPTKVVLNKKFMRMMKADKSVSNIGMSMKPKDMVKTHKSYASPNQPCKFSKR